MILDWRLISSVSYNVYPSGQKDGLSLYVPYLIGKEKAYLVLGPRLALRCGVVLLILGSRIQYSEIR